MGKKAQLVLHKTRQHLAGMSRSWKFLPGEKETTPLAWGKHGRSSGTTCISHRRGALFFQVCPR